ncbi:12004_t:CDS:2 [Funneliformis geosporum]|nr:12004_t:CDS:2 [Funneliformis geosporum]
MVPTPNVSTHTKPSLPWNFPIVRIKDKANKNTLEIGNNTQICLTGRYSQTALVM